MILNIKLNPELTEHLHAEAARRGISDEEYARALLENLLTTLKFSGGHNLPIYLTATREEWTEKFREWVDTHEDVDAPPIPAESLRRENLYEDRW